MHWVRDGEPAKHRPAVVVSVDDIFAGVESELVVVVPISRSRTPSTLRPPFAAAEGVDVDSVAVCRAVRGITKSRPIRPLGTVRPEAMREVERTLLLLG